MRRFLPLPFLTAPKSDEGGPRGEGWGEGVRSLLRFIGRRLFASGNLDGPDNMLYRLLNNERSYQMQKRYIYTVGLAAALMLIFGCSTNSERAAKMTTNGPKHTHASDLQS